MGLLKGDKKIIDLIWGQVHKRLSNLYLLLKNQAHVDVHAAQHRTDEAVFRTIESLGETQKPP